MSDPKRSKIRTFDLFDTLVARRCVKPTEVFLQVAERLGGVGFYDLRITSEAAVAGSEYTFEDIYKQMYKNSLYSAAQISALMDAELATEWQSLFPIAELVGEVNSNDLIISDIYFPNPFVNKIVREMLQLKHNPIFKSSYGKSAEWVWPLVLQHFDVEEHVGDNPVSDVKSPGSYNISARLTVLSKRTLTEEFLSDEGYVCVSNAAREARLSTFHQDDRYRTAQLLQSQVNFPVLCLASYSLIQIAEESQATNLLMSSRDCFLWHGLISRMISEAGLECRSTYFYTSRLARYRLSPTYRDYIESVSGKRNIIADICGSGHSLNSMVSELGLNNYSIYLIHQLGELKFSQTENHWGKAGELVNTRSLVSGSDSFSNYFELANSVSQSMVVDVAKIRDTFVPKFCDIPVYPNVSRQISEHCAAFDAAKRSLLAQNWIKEARSWSETRGRGTVWSLYQGFNDYTRSYELLLEQQKAEETSVWRMMEDIKRA